MRECIEKITLCVTSDFFFPELPGGTLRLFRNIVLLSERGFNVVVFTELLSGHAESELEVDGITIYRIDLGQCESRDERRARLVREMVRWYDEADCGKAILQMSSIGGVKTYFALRQVRKRKIPCILTFTIVPARDLRRGVKEWIRGRILFRSFDRFIALSGSMKQVFCEWRGIHESKVTVIPNGVDLKKFRPVDVEARKELRRKLGLRPDARIVICVGSIVPRKGIDFLLNVWKEVESLDQDATLILVGSYGKKRVTFQSEAMKKGLGLFIERVEEQLASFSRKSSIILLGERNDVELLYQAADVFVFTSHQEGCPNAVLEAMSSGLPCLTTPFEGLPEDGEEFGNNGEHFKLVERDQGAWVRVMTALLDDETLRCAIGQKARQWMEQTQNVEEVIDSQVELLNDLVSK